MQRYCNRSAEIKSCVYIFPLDDRSAICEFEVEIDGIITKGILARFIIFYAHFFIYPEKMWVSLFNLLIFID